MEHSTDEERFGSRRSEAVDAEAASSSSLASSASLETPESGSFMDVESQASTPQESALGSSVVSKIDFVRELPIELSTIIVQCLIPDRGHQGEDGEHERTTNPLKTLSDLRCVSTKWKEFVDESLESLYPGPWCFGDKKTKEQFSTDGLRTVLLKPGFWKVKQLSLSGNETGKTFCRSRISFNNLRQLSLSELSQEGVKSFLDSKGLFLNLQTLKFQRCTDLPSLCILSFDSNALCLRGSSYTMPLALEVFASPRVVSVELVSQTDQEFQKNPFFFSWSLHYPELKNLILRGYIGSGLFDLGQLPETMETLKIDSTSVNLRVFPSLKSMHLEKNGLNLESLSQWVSSYCTQDSSTKPRLERFIVKEVSLGGAGEILSQLLGSCKHLSHLTCENSGLNDGDAMVLLGALQNNTSLKEVVLASNGLSPRAIFLYQAMLTQRATWDRQSPLTIVLQ